MSKSNIYLANSEVSIYDACKTIGMPVMEYAYSSKMYCPFGDVSHADAGATPAFRVYQESNSAYCFACSMKYTPVRLVALKNDIPEEEAAQFLLELFQIVSADAEEKFNSLASPTAFAVSTADLADSLRRYCQRIDPDWETHQFESDVADAYRKCLELLPRIRTLEEVEQWREATKKVMQHRLAKYEQATY